MKDKNKPSGKNPTIQSMLEHLAKETIRPEKMDLWPTVRANLATSKTLLQSKELMMKKKFTFTALAVVLVFAIVAVFVANNVTIVSAKEVLDRAYQAQNQTGTNQGIEHIRSEIFTDIEAKGQGMDTIVESYSDPVNGNFRVVTTDKNTGKVLQVSAFDGSDVYSSDNMPDGQPGADPLTVYHNVQDPTSLTNQKFMSVMNRKLNPAQDDESKFMFEKMRSDPQVELVGQETWDNGRTVHVLRSRQEIKLMVNDEMTHPMGLVTFYFDVDTYQLLGSRVTTEKDGKEVLISSQKILLDEMLPTDSVIAWNLSDLRGINIVEDPNGEHSLPAKIALNVISVDDLASKTDSAYLLKAIPDGFSLEVSTQSEQPAAEQFVYEARYTNQAGEYFLIRALGKPLEDNSWRGETYTAAGGLVLHFVDQGGANTKQAEFTRVLIEAPNGKTYAIESSLPLDTVKAFADDLALIK